MNLKEIRKQLVEISGRSDLVKSLTNYEDNGADWYIRAACKELDRERFQTGQGIGVSVKDLDTGEWLVKVDLIRSVLAVRVVIGDKRKGLARLNRAELYSTFPNLGYDVDSGVPLYYFPTNLRYIPAESAPAPFDLGSDNSADFDGIIVLAPPDQDIQIEVEGHFYSAYLQDDDDNNFWTIAEPDVLVMGAMRELERSYRNMTGAREWTAHIEQKLLGIDMDVVEQGSAHISKMRG